LETHFAKNWSTHNMTIYVGNLAFKATESDLRDVFAEYGKIKRVVVPTDRDTGRVRGFAFVELEQGQDEDNAISQLDRAEWMGRELRLNKAKPKDSAQQIA
jgi:RNA recognition motif-containing protein